MMNLDERLQEVSVLGAAGKMGSGIALLLAKEMTLIKLAHPDWPIFLHLLDQNQSALQGLWQYLHTQATKAGEEQIGHLRNLFSSRQDLVENAEMIEVYVESFLSILRPTTSLESLQNSQLIFEAIVEKESVKIELLQKLRILCSPNTYFFTNTSSIPIHILDKQAQLAGRILGYHFYNPPAVQKLLEIICPSTIVPELKEIGLALAARLRKKVISSSDIAGFIGNGHFIRDGLYALQECRKLQEEYTLCQAIYMINKVSQDLLLRPMGIFQLIDYVGIDVFYCIQNVMRNYLGDESLQDVTIQEMITRKILGGQRSDGSQKNGFLQYEKGTVTGVYDCTTHTYQTVPSAWSQELDQKLGTYPNSYSSWKKLLSDPCQKEKIQTFFHELRDQSTMGAELARKYMQNSKKISENLVQSNVAEKAEDVNGVLTTGFFHLYGPINDYL